MDLETFVKIVISKSVDIGDLLFSDNYEDYYELVGCFVDVGGMDAANILDEQEYDICMEVINKYGNKC